MERRKQTKREWYRKESEKNERKSDGSARTPGRLAVPPGARLYFELQRGGGGGHNPKCVLCASDAMVSFMEMVRPNCEAERAGA